MGRQRSHLVVQHVERMSGRILEEHPEVIREYVKGKRGVYALYRRSKLYYVGLASDLRSRLKAHLRDRHARAWDSFSMYLTETAEHLRELEALALRITIPRGNKSKTKLAGSQDLRRYFRRQVAEAQRRELSDLFGPSGAERRASRNTRRTGREPKLAGYFTARTPLRMPYKGRIYKATVLGDGTIRFKGKLFSSPSTTASQVTKRPMNGWYWWRFEAAPGKWVRLQALRRKRSMR